LSEADRESTIANEVARQIGEYTAEIDKLRKQIFVLKGAEWGEFDQMTITYLGKGFQDGLEQGRLIGFQSGFQTGVACGSETEINSIDEVVRMGYEVASKYDPPPIDRTKPNPTTLEQAEVQVAKQIEMRPGQVYQFREAQAAHPALVASHCNCRHLDATKTGKSGALYNLTESHTYHPKKVAKTIAGFMVQRPMKVLSSQSHRGSLLTLIQRRRQAHYDQAIGCRHQ
jgi:hypothetical protein